MNLTRARRRRALKRAALVLAALYLVTLALIAFWPTPVDRSSHTALLSTLDWMHSHGLPTWLGYAFVEFTANIALFVPVGLLGVILIGARHWWLAILTGFLASCTIELGQLLFLPARFASVKDVIANTSGAVVGAALALLVLVVVHRTPVPSRPAVAVALSAPARARSEAGPEA